MSSLTQGLLDGMSKTATKEGRQWVGTGLAAGTGLGLIKAFRTNRAYRKRSVLFRHLSHVFDKKPKLVGYGRGAAVGGALGAAAAYALLTGKRAIFGGRPDVQPVSVSEEG
jgi:hypothetical protein